MEYLSPPLEQNPTALLELFNEAMEVYFPGWKASSGNLDGRIAAAQSLIDAQLMEAASDGATNIFRFFGASVFGVPPHEGIQATGLATWVMTDTLGHTIPAGTVAVWVDSLGTRRGLETVEPFTIAPAAKEATGIPMRAVEAGAEANGLTGAAVELTSPVAYLASVTLTSPTTGGSEAEEDGAYLARLASELKTMSRKPITPSDFNILVGGTEPVGRITTLRGFNPIATVKDKAKLTSASNELTGLKASTTELLTIGSEVTGTGIPASTFITEIGATTVKLSNKATETKENELTFTGLLKQAGFVSSYVGKPNGEALTSEQMSAIETAFQEQMLAGVTFKVLAPKYTTINVSVTVFAWPGQNATVIKEAVEGAIKSYLSAELWGQPPTGQSKEWNNDPKVRLVNTEHAILQIVGTHYASSLTLNAAAEDVLMSGVVALPKLGTLSVTVNIG